MPRVIDLADEGVLALDECVERLSRRGFDPGDEDSLLEAARDLRRLGNDRRFLGDILIDELKRRDQPDAATTAYGPQAVMLSRPSGEFYLRANIWPAPGEHALRDVRRRPDCSHARHSDTRQGFLNHWRRHVLAPRHRPRI